MKILNGMKLVLVAMFALLLLNSTVYAESAYTLTEVDEPGANVITKYIYDSVSGELTPVYYEVSLNKTTYGEGNSSLTYTVNGINGGTYEIIANYSDENLHERITENMDGADVQWDFVGLSGTESGGAIYNSADDTIGNIESNFINNSITYTGTTKSTTAGGGAVYNEGQIENIKSNFIGNSVYASTSRDGTTTMEAYGGAIYNNSEIGSISGNFIGNDASGEYTGTNSSNNHYCYSYGGAICNDSKGIIDSITGVFIGNSASSDRSYGGAIYNKGEIGSISGDFIGNYAGLGSAIYNAGTIGNITGNFIGNSGDVIYNYLESTIGSITGVFIGNSGNAIYNYGTIGNITGNFIGNWCAISNGHNEIQSISGNFFGNYSSTGGAIWNVGVIWNIDGTFIGNYADSAIGSVSYNNVNGGVIHSESWTGYISGEFIGNYAKDSANGGYTVQGGAVWGGAEYEISGTFTNNYAESTSGNASGGALWGMAPLISGEFYSNYVKSESGNVWGGAIDAENKGGSISASFYGNYAESENGSAYAGAIYNYVTIETLAGDFVGNYATGFVYVGGGAICNDKTIKSLESDFMYNYAESESNQAWGGAISNDGTIGDIKGDFIGNYASTSGTSYAAGGAIDNSGATIGNITGDFTGNYASADQVAYGGAISNSGTIGSTTDDTEPYSSTGDDNSTGGIINSSFYNNYAESTSGEAKGGAIYTTTDLNFVSTDGYTMVFSGNYTKSGDEVDDNAIYVASSSATLNFDLSNGGAVVMEDNIKGADGYSVDIVGDDVDNTTFYMLNDMYSANLSVGGTTLNTVNNEIHVYDFASFTLTDNVNMVVDVDLKNETMDRIATNNNYGEHQGTLTVSGWNILSDTTEDSVSIYFAEEGLKDYVANGSNNELPTSYQTTAYTPIYRYIVEYDNREDGGYFVFTKGAQITNNPSDSFNPAVLVSSVASQLGAYTALTTTYEYAFEHSNYYMKLPNATRLAMQNGNKYAITENNNTFYQSNEMTDRGMWYRPYTSFESANLKHGPKVDAINYGTLIGGDGDFKEYKNGWGGVFSAYVGYNGSSLSYSGVHTYQNGGLLGVTQTFYKNNFFTALTATAGASVGEASTMYGHENFTMLMAGVASKTGYNLEFKEGRFIVQPSLLLSYSFINTFDYRNAAGVRINSDPLHAIEINPNIRFVMNCRNGWQPYASVGMIWNILDETKVTANNVTLPEMSIRPYVEYGLGIQRLWNDKYGGYFQAMVRNGGRNGVVLTAGFRYKFGKEPKTVKNNGGNAISERKVIKQLTPTNTVSERKVIKQL